MNVGRVANLLGANILTTGYIGGKIGELILGRLADEGIQHDFYKANGESGICIAMLQKANKLLFLKVVLMTLLIVIIQRRLLGKRNHAKLLK